MADQFLSLDDISTAKDVDFVVVPIPEWGGALRLGSVSAEVSLHYMDMLEKDPHARTDSIWNLIAQCVVDGEGNRLVKTDEDRRKFVEIIKKKDVRVTDRITAAVFDLCGIRVPGRVAPKNDSGGEVSASSPSQLPEAVGV